MSPEVDVASTVAWPVPARLARRVAEGVLRAEGAKGARLSLAFVGPRRMRTLNRTFLGKDRPTDVIAFSYDGPTDRRTDGPTRNRSSVVGEIYVCADIAARNARRFGVAPREETLRLVVHGVLHVLGYDHHEGSGRTAGPMWRRQERYLARFAR